MGSNGSLFLSLDVYFKFCCLSFRTLTFGIVIMYFQETLMYEMDKYCNSFSLLDPWEKCGSFGFSPRVCPTDIARSSLLLRCLVSGGRRAPP